MLANAGYRRVADGGVVIVDYVVGKLIQDLLRLVGREERYEDGRILGGLQFSYIHTPNNSRFEYARGQVRYEQRACHRS